MTTGTRTAVDTCDDILDALQEYNLTSSKGINLAQAFCQSSPGCPPCDLLHYLVEKNCLSRFQAETILSGAASELVLPSYSLIDVIGSGSLGKVYKAQSFKESGWFVVKIVPRRNVINLKSIAEKVEALKQVRHPRVSSLVHIGAQGGRVYLVWPYIEGGEKLDHLVKRHGSLSGRQAAQVGLQVASGLQAYHQAGLFHGLLKPDEIIIGQDRRVRLLDFGVGFLLTCERGKSLLSTMTSGETMSKGLDFASPESIADPLARSVFSDQYSLGCILYFCLTGQVPYPASNPVKKMLGHQFEETTPLPELAPETPPRLVTIVQRLMQKHPEDRYENIQKVIHELQVITSGGPGSQAPSPGPMSRLDVERPSQLYLRKVVAATSPKVPRPSAEEREETHQDIPSTKSDTEATDWMGVWMAVVGIASGVVSGLLVWLMHRG